MTPTDLADLFRNARKGAHMTQHQAAGVLGMSRTNLEKLERGGNLSFAALYLTRLETLGLEICVRKARP